MKAVMRKQSIIRESTCLMIFIGFFTTIYGCDEEPEPEVDLSLPEVVSTIPSQGAEVPGNAAVTFTLNKPLAEARVKGAEGKTTIAGRIVTFIPSPAIAGGPVTLTLTGTDRYGQELEPFELSFTALVACGGSWPTLDGAECKPKDGASGVDPVEYPEKLVIAFNEALSHARVMSTKPKFPYATELSKDGKTLEISFVDYTMPYETEFVIRLSATDLAGNAADLEYSFTTMIKE